MFKKKPSTAVKSGASAPQGLPLTEVPVASVGNPAVAKHIKKQHIHHNKGMQVTKPITGSAPAASVPSMPNPNPYTSQQ